jgi:hypothetical protein
VDRYRVTLAITVRPDVLAAAKRHVAHGHAASLSAWIEQAMEEKAGRSELIGLLADMQAIEETTDAPSLKAAAAPTPLPRRSRQVV